MKAQHTQTYETLLKQLLGGKFIALSAHIKKLEKAHISDLTAHLKALEADIPRRSRRKEIIKLRVEINNTETKKTIKQYKESTKQRADSLRKSTR